MPAALEPTLVPDQASATFTRAATRTRAGSTGKIIQYRVEVEDGLGFDTNQFATAVASTLGDPRGWTEDGQFQFESTPDATLRVVLASPSMTDQLCAPLQTRGEVSCRNGDDVVINARRWANAVPHIPDLALYRNYVINHEVGHALGFSHEACPQSGAAAPVMAQQTLGLQGCEPNPWP